MIIKDLLVIMPELPKRTKKYIPHIPFISTIFLDFIPLPPPPLIQTLLRIALQHLPFLSQVRPLGLFQQSKLVVHSKISFLNLQRCVTINLLKDQEEPTRPH